MNTENLPGTNMENLPHWHDKPTDEGLWLYSDKGMIFVAYLRKLNDTDIKTFTRVGETRYYGPLVLPPDPQQVQP
jgi:hypothetical protein